jgi:hypothetical protein
VPGVEQGRIQIGTLPLIMLILGEEQDTAMSYEDHVAACDELLVEVALARLIA